MATWDSYTQKSTPADNDTLMIKDTSGGANKRTPFSGVWNWIVSKLASAVISQLETTNKSIIPAINELNSKTLKRHTNQLNLTGTDNVEDKLLEANKQAENGDIYYYRIRTVDLTNTHPILGKNVWLMIGFKHTDTSPDGYGTQILFNYSSSYIAIFQISNETKRWLKITGEVIEN